MNIHSINIYDKRYNCNNPKLGTPSFKSASDFTLQYVLNKHSALLPKSMKEAVTQLVYNPVFKMPTLEKLHHKVYEKLMSAKTLDEVKALYPEFSDVKDSSILKQSRSFAAKLIEKNMPIGEFSLAYLKDLYSLTPAKAIVKKYGFTNRSLLQWLNKKLNIEKPKSNYYNIVSMSNEEKNNRASEMTRQFLKNNPDLHKKMLAKSAETHKTAAYREKKRQENIDFYKREPAARIRISKISQMTWDKCPQIKAALAEYTYEQQSILKKALKDRNERKILSQPQKRLIAGYYKHFWEAHPEFKEQYRQARLDVIEELKKEGLIL